jgi:hypothetical protein
MMSNRGRLRADPGPGRFVSRHECRFVSRLPAGEVGVVRQVVDQLADHETVTAAVIAAGRKPRGRAVDLMIAATAVAEGLPLYTTIPADFTGLDALIRIIAVTRPPVPHEQLTR